MLQHCAPYPLDYYYFLNKSPCDTAYCKKRQASMRPFAPPGLDFHKVPEVIQLHYNQQHQTTRDEVSNLRACKRHHTSPAPTSPFPSSSSSSHPPGIEEISAWAKSPSESFVVAQTEGELGVSREARPQILPGVFVLRLVYFRKVFSSLVR